MHRSPILVNVLYFSIINILATLAFHHLQIRAMKKLNLLFTVLCLSLLGFSMTAQDDEMTFVTTVEGISEYKLGNGLRVLLFPDQSKPQVTVNVTYLVGSRHEDYGETGMAHLLEHLVFKGTPSHKDIAKELKDHGAFFNGTTWYDRTNYFETLTATDENLEWALDMESDRMVNSFISAEDLESEMTVVRNEFEMGENNPTGVLMKRVMSASYQWHNYGQTTIGARADLENVPIDKLQAFYREYYQPDNAVLLIVGKFDEEKTKGLVKKYFGAIPKPERVLNTTYTREPTQDGEREVSLRRVGDVQALAAMYHICAMAHPDYAPLSVLTELLTTEPGGRLYKSLVEEKKTTNVWGWAAGLNEPGFIYFGADVLKDKDLDEAKNTLLSTLDNLKNNPPTQEEVERAKTSLIKQFELSFNDSRRIGVFASNYIASGDWRLAFLDRDRVKETTLEDVMRVAEKYIKPSNRTVGKFIPEEAPDRVEIPEAPEIMSLVADYKGGEAISQGEVFDPTPSNIEGRLMREVKSNKIDYAFMPKETRGDAVQAVLTFKYGTEASLRNKAWVANLTGSMLDKGTTTKTRQEIKDAFDNMKANVRISAFYGTMNVRIETEREYLADVIRLVGDVVKNPSFSSDEYGKLIDEELAQIEEQKSQPMALAQQEIQRIVNPYPKSDIRYNSTFEEDKQMLKNTSVEDIKAFYGDFYGANNATATVVGDFDKEEIHKVLEEEFGTWRAKKPYKRLDAILFDVDGQDKNIETPDKANAGFFAGYNFAMKDSDPDYPALMVANYIFGGGGLSSRIANRIRQEDGLSYGVGSYMNANPHVEKTTWGAYAIYAPENREALEKAFAEELAKALKDGFTDAEVEDAKKGWIQNQAVSRSQDGYLTNTINGYLDYDRTMMWNAELEEKVAGLTTKDINNAFKKYIKPDKISYVKAGDFAKGAIKP